jgi:putative transposase
MGEGRRKRRRRVEPTDDWKQLKLLFGWPEQVRYEELRPLVLFGSSVAERAIEIEAAERTLYRRMDRFETEEMESLFDSETARHRKLLPTIRRLIVDLKAEHPRLSLGEIASICYVGFGRRPSKHTVKRILEEEPMPLKMVRRFDPYHEIEEPMERRMAVVRLHSEGWAPKSIAGYLGMHKSTVYRVLKRWIEEGEQGLEDKPHGRPSGVRKVDLKAIEAIRRLQQNPHLGAFRVHAALAQMGIHLSPATCGRILALNRRLYGLDKPRGPSQEKREMPFASSRRHEYWTTDVRYVEHRLGGNIYVISVLENHSRAILASGIFRSQDLPSYLSVLYSAVERYGSPEAIVTDGGAIFRANQALSIYEALNIDKEEIERGRPWQSYIERPPSTSSAGWPTGTSQGPRAGPSSWPFMNGGFRTTTSRATGPTASAKTVDARHRRFSAGSPECVTARRIWTEHSSRPAFRAPSTLWAMPGSETGGSTGRKDLPRGRQLCGWLPRALRWSTQERPSRATMSNTSLTRASLKR